MRPKTLTTEEQAAYRALARAAARLREAQEKAERQEQADPGHAQSTANEEGRADD